MRFVVRDSNKIYPDGYISYGVKSALLATNHSHSYGAKLKVSIATDFEVFGGRNRLSF